MGSNLPPSSLVLCVCVMGLNTQGFGGFYRKSRGLLVGVAWCRRSLSVCTLHPSAHQTCLSPPSSTWRACGWWCPLKWRGLFWFYTMGLCRGSGDAYGPLLESRFAVRQVNTQYYQNNRNWISWNTITRVLFFKCTYYIVIDWLLCTALKKKKALHLKYSQVKVKF